MAIAIVMFHHFTIVHTGFPGARIVSTVAKFGWCGVDLFFVLSGFLITGILLDTRNNPNCWLNFYARRVLRIFPPYFLLLLIFAVLVPLSASPVARIYRELDQIWLWTFFANVWIAKTNAWLPGGLAPLWSLSVEEQFYLVWPFIVVSCTARRFRWICIAGFCVAPALRVCLLSIGIAPIAIYVLPFTRLDSLLAGSLVALAARDIRTAQFVRRLTNPWLLGCAPLVLLAIVAGWGPTQLSGPMQVLGYTVLSVLGAACVRVLATAERPNTLSTVFGTCSLRALGKYSYSLYLFHYPIASVLLAAGLDPAWYDVAAHRAVAQLLFYVVATALTLSCSVATWYLLESPFLQLKSYFH